MNKLFIIIPIIIIFVIFFKNNEKFSVFRHFDCAEFRGINSLSNTDSSFAVNSLQECQDVCARNDDCVGYSYYKPGNSCFLFNSGNMIGNKQGFQAGVKLNYGY